MKTRTRRARLIVDKCGGISCTVDDALKLKQSLFAQMLQKAAKEK
jgi:hypothetical protein